MEILSNIDPDAIRKIISLNNTQILFAKIENKIKYYLIKIDEKESNDKKIIVKKAEKQELKDDTVKKNEKTLLYILQNAEKKHNTEIAIIIDKKEIYIINKKYEILTKKYKISFTGIMRFISHYI